MFCGSLTFGLHRSNLYATGSPRDNCLSFSSIYREKRDSISPKLPATSPSALQPTPISLADKTHTSIQCQGQWGTQVMQWVVCLGN